MKALSVKQPWASLIACGFKTIECRTWKTNYRGPLLICASQGDFVLDDGVRLYGGHALAVAELVDVRRMEKADAEAACLPDDADASVFDGYAWVLRRESEIIPVSVKGKLNLFNVDITPEPLPAQYADHTEYFTAIHG